MKFRVTIEQDEDGNFVAQCPSLPGCISQGKNREKALTNIRDAIQGYLTSLKKHNEAIPPPIEEETVEVRPKLPVVSGVEVVKALAKIGYELAHLRLL